MKRRVISSPKTRTQVLCRNPGCVSSLQAIQSFAGGTSGVPPSANGLGIPRRGIPSGARGTTPGADDPSTRSAAVLALARDRPERTERARDDGDSPVPRPSASGFLAEGSRAERGTRRGRRGCAATGPVRNPHNGCGCDRQKIRLE